MLLTESQIHAIKQIIADHHNAFIANTISPDAVASDVLEALKAKGLVSPKISSIQDAYLYGQILAALDNPATAKMSYAEFKKYISKNPVPLSDVEKQAVKMAQLNAAQYVRGLGNKIDIATGNILIEADAKLRNKLKEEIRERTAENIEERETVKQLKSDLGWATSDWTRDWDRIAVTEKHNAMQQGLADHLVKRHGTEVLVAKRPMPDACQHCKRLHIGPDGQPRIFRLLDLEKNGTNVGRKANDWRAVVGAVHPNCMCQMVRIPAGWGFDKDGDLVPGGKLGVRYADEGDLALAMLQENDLQKSMEREKYLEFQGLPIVIENAVGSKRTWQDGEGGTGTTVMLNAYGYISGTMGADGDAIDCYIGPDPRAKLVYVIHQQNPKNGIWDEDKCMLGFSNEEDARYAYQAHYTRPDFLITVSPMDMDAFKRWISGTKIQKSQTASQPTGPRLVILEKAATTPEDASQDSRADARAPSWGNTGVNYYFDTPERTPPAMGKDVGFDPKPKDILTDKEKRKAIKRDKRIYDMIEPCHRKTIEVADTMARAGAGSLIGTGTDEANRFWLDTHGVNLSGGLHNEAPVPEIKQPKLVLVKALKGEAAASHKYISRKWMKGSWVYTYAEHHGGKVSDHHTDLNKVVLKLPLEKKPKLEEFKAKYNISGNVFSGNKYAMVDITEAEANELHKQAKIPEKAKPPATIPESKKTKAVKASDIKILKSLETVSKDKMAKPKWDTANFIQPGERVSVSGKKGTVIGLTTVGIAVVEYEGSKEIENVPWAQVKRTESPASYKSTYDRLSDKAKIYKLDTKAQEFLDKALQDAPVPGTTFQNYMDALRNHAAETFLVGGFTRDVISMTVNDGEHSNEAIYKALHDFDVCTTASPSSVHGSVVNKTPKEKSIAIEDNKNWGVVSVRSKGHPGLDVAIVVSKGGHAEKEDLRVFDHDLELDTRRRDFTCNSLFYDVDNKVLVDPTGFGLGDAQNKVLRLPPMTKAEQYENKSLPWRYLKFRARGWKPEQETMDRVTKQFYDQLPNASYGSKEKMIEKMFVVKGISRKEALSKIRDVMEADGMLDLYEKHLSKM